jgi:hypothetical protein
MSSIYRETFDRGPGGWISSFASSGNFDSGGAPLGWKKGRMTTRSPWWDDYNHAPPGAGYLHMLFTLNTRGPFGEQTKEVGGPNRFVAGGYSRDFRNARLTLRLRGELATRGAEVVLLVQSKIGDICTGWLLTSRPFKVGKQWKEQSAVLSVNEKKWTALGGRYNRLDYYNVLPLESALREVRTNIMLVLFPLDVRPMGPLKGNPHRLRPGRDYPVWTSHLPEGYIELDTVQIETKH